MEKINKVLILGGPGSGKTTLANKLAKILKLPIINLDSINYEKNWTPREEHERDKIILEKTKEDKWIMDGVYKTTLEERANSADIIIFLEYPTYYLLFRIIKRYFSNYNKEKKELDGCKERLTWNFIKYTLKFNSKKKGIYEILYNVKNIEEKLIILKKGKL